MKAAIHPQPCDGTYVPSHVRPAAAGGCHYAAECRWHSVPECHWHSAAECRWHNAAECRWHNGLVSFYEEVGGEETFRRLVDTFYERVATDPLLRPLYPEADLTGAADRLRLFLEQYWGGPKTYGEQRGHPRLRHRHVPFRIGPAERDAWLAHMRQALNTLELDAAHDAELWDYLERAAHFMVNYLPTPTSASGSPELEQR